MSNFNNILSERRDALVAQYSLLERQLGDGDYHKARVTKALSDAVSQVNDLGDIPKGELANHLVNIMNQIPEYVKQGIDELSGSISSVTSRISEIDILLEELGKNNKQAIQEEAKIEVKSEKEKHNKEAVKERPRPETKRRRPKKAKKTDN